MIGVQSCSTPKIAKGIIISKPNLLNVKLGWYELQNEPGRMTNNNQDPVRLAKKVTDQLDRFPRGKSLEWKMNFLKCKFEKQNFGNCCKTIIYGAEVALKVEEKLLCMEAQVKSGVADERLRHKVELVRRKMERYHFLMHLLSVSKNPGEFAACVRNFKRNGRKLREESKTENIEECPAKNIERINHHYPRANEENQSAEDGEKRQVKEMKVGYEEGSIRQHSDAPSSAPEVKVLISFEMSISSQPMSRSVQLIVYNVEFVHL